MQIEQPNAPSGPRVSVVMAVNRSDHYLTQAVESILHQSFADFEFLIVVDKNSAQTVSDTLDRYRTDPRIRILISPTLGGLALALNLGIAEARGDYIARMDGDDISLPDRLLHQVRFLDEHPEVAVLGCRAALIDSDSQFTDRHLPFYETNDDIRNILPIRNPMPHPALMMRKSALYAVGGYKFGHASEDYELHLRLSREPQFQFHNLNAVLFYYRRHGNQETGTGYFRRRFPDMAGFLFAESLRRRSPRFLMGIIVIHPLVRRLRSLITRHPDELPIN